MIKIWLKKSHNKLNGKAIHVKDYLRYQQQFDEYKRLRQQKQSVKSPYYCSPEE